MRNELNLTYRRANRQVILHMNQNMNMAMKVYLQIFSLANYLFLSVTVCSVKGDIRDQPWQGKGQGKSLWGLWRERERETERNPFIVASLTRI